MKLDQETVVKHQFWFLLGGYFLLWLIAILWMKFTYPDEIVKLQDTYKKSADGVKSAMSQGPVNTATFLPPWVKETQEFSAHKGVIWGDAWHFQEGMYDWPREWVKKYDGMRTPQVQISSDDRNDYKEKLYPSQISYWRTNAPKWLNPVELKDGFDNVFQPKKDWRETPTREEVWLAQEDYWVKRELLVVVYNAMAQQALMLPVEIDEKKEPAPKGAEARYRYQNKNWEITLNIRKSDKGFVIGGDSTIKNIHPSRHPQALTSAKGKGVWFNVAQDNVQTTFEVRGEPVNWNETKHFSEEDYPDPLSGIKWDKEYIKEHPILVSQGFDQSNCPIRRINAIELAKQDCRTFIWPLQPNHMLAQLDALPEDQDPSKKADGGTGGTGGAGAPGGGAGSGGMMPGGGGGSMRPAGIGGGGGGAAPAGNKTPNNDIERDRYLQPTSLDKKLNPPSHHLPLAIQVIVEQSHMHDMLLALANSRLRFQITQVEFKHEKNFTPQSDDKDKKDGSAGDAPKVFTGGMPGMGGSQQMQMMMRMRQMQGPAGGGSGRSGMGGMGSSGMRGGPAMPGAMAPGGMRGGPAMPGAMAPGGMRGGPTMGGPQTQSKFTYAPGAMRGAAPTAGGVDPNQAATDQHDDNLVELTIYGIATLYREPDAPQTTTPSAPTGTPAPQPGQQQAAPAPSGGGAATPSATTAQPGGATQPQTGTTQQGGASTPQATPKQPSSGVPSPQAPSTKPGDGSAPEAPKQSDKTVDQKKAPPPPPPPADKKR